MLFAGPKSARNILTNLSLKPAQTKTPSPTYNSGVESAKLPPVAESGEVFRTLGERSGNWVNYLKWGKNENVRSAMS